MAQDPDAAHGARLLSSMNRQQRRSVAAAVRGSERSSTWNAYYSRVRFPFAVSGAGPFVYTMAAGTERRAFSYPIGADMGGVGLPGTIATKADTNLLKGGETVSGEKLLVYGLSLYIGETSEPELIKALWPKLSVTLGLNGMQTVFSLGLAGFIPGGGGLCGAGDSLLAAPPIAESYGRGIGSLTNGVPGVQNFLPFPEKVIWNPSGSNDSTLTLQLRVEADAVFTTQLAADRAAAAGIAAWAHPTGTANGTFVDVVARLWSRQVSDRSENA